MVQHPYTTCLGLPVRTAEWCGQGWLTGGSVWGGSPSWQSQTGRVWDMITVICPPALQPSPTRRPDSPNGPRDHGTTAVFPGAHAAGSAAVDRGGEERRWGMEVGIGRVLDGFCFGFVGWLLMGFSEAERTFFLFFFSFLSGRRQETSSCLVLWTSILLMPLELQSWWSWVPQAARKGSRTTERVVSWTPLTSSIQ